MTIRRVEIIVGKRSTLIQKEIHDIITIRKVEIIVRKRSHFDLDRDPGHHDDEENRDYY
jgi:hypothetical protein